MILQLFHHHLHGTDLESWKSEIPGDNEEKAVSLRVEVFVDSSGVMALLDVLRKKRQKQFVPLQEFSQATVRKVAYWGKVTAQNNAEGREWILRFPVNDHIEVYVPEGSGYTIKRCGYLVPKSLKDIPHDSYAIRINIPRGEPYEFYYRLINTFHDKPQLDLQIESLNENIERASNSYLLDFLFQGFVWMMVLYNLGIFIKSLDKIYLDYSFYLMGVSLFYLFLSGILREMIIPEYPELTPYGMISASVAPMFYYGFLRKFSDTPKVVPRWDYLIDYLILFGLALSFVAVMILVIFNNIQIASYVIQVSVLVNGSFGLFFIFQLFRKRNEVINYFLLGTVTLVLAALINAVVWIPGYSRAQIFQAGFVAEILFFSLGLGRRVRVIEREKQEAQSALISEMVKNHQLTQAKKAELENKVQARTAEIERQKEEILAAKQRAEEAAQAKAEFLSVMSHEIRTPLNSIIGSSYMLSKENMDEDQIEHLRAMKMSAENLLSLTNDILDFDKIRSGKIRFEKLKIDVQDFIKKHHQLFSPRAHEKGISLRYEIDRDIPATIVGDPVRLTQILNNLVNNAIKFTQSGQVLVKMELYKRYKKKIKIDFSVEDSGIGIPRDKIDYIFDRFTQVHSESSRKFGGSGLGLAITKQLVELQGGQIMVQSVEGEGTLFYFTLDFDLEDHVRIEKRTLDETQLSGKKILVVEDDRMNKRVIESFLSQWDVGYQIVDNGKSVMESLLAEDFDMVLMDLHMPDMDGYEIARTIRSLGDKKFVKLPILAISADVSTGVRNKVKAHGMNDYLSKPFKPEQLLELILKYT